MQVQDCALLSWEVEIPKRQGGSLSYGRKPRATLVIESEGDVEHIKLPVAVGRRLKAKRKAGEFEPVSRAELLGGVDQASDYCARMRIERLINRREYASSELRDKLREDGYAEELIDACVRRAIEVGLVSDGRFADSFIRSKLLAGWGAERIERELARHGIAIEDVAGWPYEYFDPADELARAIEIASRRRVSGANAYQKLVRHLATRGFSLDLSMRAARQILDGCDDR